MVLLGDYLPCPACQFFSSLCRDVLDVLLASLGMFGGVKFLGEHEITLLGPANKVFLDTVHSFVVHLKCQLW